MTVTRPLPWLAAPAASPRARPVLSSRAIELALPVGLVVLALAARLPYLWTIPRFTDETREILLAYQILRGEDPGLVNVDAYIGGLYNWLLAAIFWVAGPSWGVPRLLVAFAGALAVGATYLMGRETAGRGAGIIAAALLATAGGHIVATGHIAWSHCLTPLFTTVGAWLLQRAVLNRQVVPLLASGLTFGIAFQTHPAALVLLPGAAIYLLWWGRAWLRTPWPYLALALFFIGYLNVMVYNLMTGADSLQAAGEIREHYARGRPILISLDTYLGNHGVQALMLLRYLAGAIDARPGGASAYLTDPSVWVYGGLSLAGLAVAARRGAPLPLLMVASSIVIMPYFNERKYAPISDGRYLMPVLPLAFVGVGALAATVWHRLPAVWAPWRMGFTLAIAALVLYPLVPLTRYFDQETLSGRTNDDLFETLSTVLAARRPQEQVLIDSDLRDIKYDGGGTAFRAMRFLLAGSGIPERSVDDVFDHVRRQPPGWSAVTIVDYEKFRRFETERARMREQGAIGSVIAAPTSPTGFGLIRAEREGEDRPTPQSASQRSGPVPVEIFATGLVNPRGLLFHPDGSLLVAEAGLGGPTMVDVGREKPHAIGRTGRITRFTMGGNRSEIAQGLPSIVTALGEEVGPTSLGMLGDRLFVLTASGGWDVGDPDFHSGLFEIRQDGSLGRVADLTSYIKEHPSRTRQEDPRADVPYGMPYGLAVQDGQFFVTDANQEQILAVSTTGEINRIADYPRSNRALTGVAAGPDGALYVAEFASQKVTRVAHDGQISDAATKLRTPIGVAFDPDGSMYVLEFTGRVLRAAPAGQEQRDILAEGLRNPTAITVGPDGNLYVSVMGHKSDRGEGQIVRLRLRPPPAVPPERWIAFAGPWIGGLIVFVIAMSIGWRFRKRA